MNAINQLVHNITSDIERACQDKNFDAIFNMGADDIQNLIPKLQSHDSRSMQKVVELLFGRDGQRSSPSTMIKALGELGFREHLFLYETLATNYASFSSDITRKEFSQSANAISPWRNDFRAHTKLIPNQSEDHIDEFFRGAEQICRELGIFEKLAEHRTAYLNAEDHPLVKNNLPNPEYEQDGGRFFGRIQERKKIKNSIKNNFVTCIAGRGGLGKTALAQNICSEIISSSEALFDYVVWFTNKTDEMSDKGIRPLRTMDNSYLHLLQNFLRAVDPELESDDIEEISSFLNEYVNRTDRTLIVLDNFETFEETCSLEDYQRFCQLLEGNNEMPCPGTVKWLVTSRNLVRFGKTITLEKMEDSDAERLLMQSANATDNFPTNYLKKLQKKQTRIQWIHQLHNYPLYIKIVCGLMGQGQSWESCLGQNRKLDELEEFCFRNTSEFINSQNRSIVRQIILLIDNAQKKGIDDLSGADFRDSLGLSLEEMDDAVSLLRSICVLVQNENGTIQIAPGMKSYLKRNVEYSPKENTITHEALSRIQEERQVALYLCGNNVAANIKPHLIASKKLWVRIKKSQPELLSTLSPEIRDSKFRNHLELASEFKQPSISSEIVRKYWPNVQTEISNGFCYWPFIQILWDSTIKTKSHSLEELVELAEFLNAQFPNIVEARTNLAVQQIYTQSRSANSNSEVLRTAFQSLLDVKNSGYNRTFEFRSWKRACHRAFKYCAINQVYLKGSAHSSAQELLDIMTKEFRISNIDTIWTKRINSYMLEVFGEFWLNWLTKGHEHFHDEVVDFDQAQLWAELQETNSFRRP